MIASNTPAITWLILMLMAHFLADFYWQKTAWVLARNDARQGRQNMPCSFYYHIAVHVSLMSMVLGLAVWFGGYALSKAVLAVLIIAVSHAAIDWCKAAYQGFLAFMVDQLAHLLVIACLWAWLSQGIDGALLGQWLANLLTAKHLIVVLAYILILKPTSIFLRIALKDISPEASAGADAKDSAVQCENNGKDDNAEDNDGGAGSLIGMLERTLILSFVLMGQYTGIGFLIAAKSIFRFGDLTDKNHAALTEYVMIGTLSSVVISLLVGGVVSQLLLLV